MMKTHNFTVELNTCNLFTLLENKTEFALLRSTTCTVGCLRCGMDLAAHYHHPTSCPASQGAACN